MSTQTQQDKPRLVRTLASGLWFPTLFFFGFILCYLLPFHAPSPHDLPVAVASPQVAEALQSGFAKSAPGIFDIKAAADREAAIHMVQDRDDVAAYVATGNGATLYIASAAGPPLATVATTAFKAVAQQTGASLETVELAPLAAGDISGAGLFYLAMVWNLVPYITVMMLQRATMNRRTKLLTVAGVGAFVTVVGFYIGVAIDVIPNHPLTMLYAFMLTQGVAWTTFGLVPFVRQFIPGVAVTLFVLLSIPSSGGAIPYQMVPGFFRFMHPIMPLGNLIDAAHGTLNFNNAGLLRPTLVLAAWMLFGMVLIVGRSIWQRRQLSKPAGEASADAPVEDPIIAAPEPHALTPGRQEPFGAGSPMVHGRVYQAEGQPVGQAFVTFLANGGKQLLSTHTDDEGNYAASGLPEDPVSVILLARGFTPAATQIVPSMGQSLRQDFKLTPAEGGRRIPVNAK